MIGLSIHLPYCNVRHRGRANPVLYLHRVHTKKVTLIFSPWLLRNNIDRFSYFFVHNFNRKCQSHWRKNFLPYIRYVATIPCENVRHKSNTFHTILALCTCLYRSHLGEPLSMKQTKHSRKSESQNLHSKYLPFTRTYAFKRLHHCAIAAGMIVWSSMQPPLAQQIWCSFNSFTSWICERTLSWRIPRCCSLPDSNLANWMATSVEG